MMVCLERRGDKARGAREAPVASLVASRSSLQFADRLPNLIVAIEKD